MAKLALVLLLAASELTFAQPVSVGVLGGIPFIDQTNAGQDESRPYVVGPSVEVRLPGGFALEADALYQRLGTTVSYQFLAGATISTGPTIISAFPTIALSNRLRANMWEFPVLGKYYFRRRSSVWQPFVGTGWALRTAQLHQAGTTANVDANGALTIVSFQNSFRSDLEVGATVAAGLRYRVGRLALLPEVRYTHWGGNNNILSKNEAGFYLG